MDPLSQGTLGAAAVLAFWARDDRLSPGTIALIGALGAMAPDLDVLIRSSEDSLLAIEYHRHFTHSLAFVPVGSLLALLPWLLSAKIRSQFRFAWLLSAVGYATHAPLDCATTYGTLYFWPFSDYRVSLSWVSVVDPLFTLPLLAFVLFSWKKHSLRLAQLGLALGLGYLALGALQKWRVLEMQRELGESRNHQAVRADAFTTFMNQVTWRSVYESGGRIFVDQIRVPYLGKSCVKEGDSITPAPPPPPGLGPRAARGHRLIRWFSSGWVAQDPDDENFIFDLRYSLLPYELHPFWGVRIDEERDDAVWVNTRSERKVRGSMVVDLIFRNPPGSVCEP
jgi:inner membrane protein